MLFACWLCCPSNSLSSSVSSAIQGKLIPSSLAGYKEGYLWFTGSKPSPPSDTLGRYTYAPLQANTPASPTLDASPPLQSRKQQEVREQGASPILMIARHQPKIAIDISQRLPSRAICTSSHLLSSACSRCNCCLQPTLQTYLHLNCLQFPTLGQRYDELQFYPDILAKQVFPPRLSQSSSHYMSGTNVGLRDHT